jgi:hypothetical protein
VLGRAGRAAHDADPLHRLREEHAPVVGLLAPHRPAVDEPHVLDPEPLREQPALGHHVVVGGDEGEAPEVVGEGGVARRGREPVREHVRDDDEVAPRVEDPSLADQPLDVGVMGAVGGRVDDDVRAVGRELAVGAVDDPRLLQGEPALQREVTEVEDVRFAHVARLARGARPTAARAGGRVRSPITPRTRSPAPRTSPAGVRCARSSPRRGGRRPAPSPSGAR